MMQLRVSEVTQATGARLYAPDAGVGERVVEGLTWDSREVKDGMVFLAMPGERVDGNDYIVPAIQQGAGAVIATREPDDKLRAIAGEFACPLLIVEDGPAALTALAGYWRGRLSAVVIGVTGSTGKTSTKDFLRSVLSQRYVTVATQGNHNNEIGVPATILEAGPDTEALVVEVGMRGLGQIEELCKTVRPNIGVVTNIGVSHLELLGSQENIARAKSELLQALPDKGLAVLNADDPFTPRLREFGGVDERGVETRLYGLDGTADVRAEDISFGEAACAGFELDARGLPAERVQLSMPGRHNVMNALAAACVGQYLGLSAEEIRAGLEQAKGSGMRLEVERSAGGVTVVNDAYNANPDSMRASLDTLAHMDCAGKRVAVLGDMGELGSDERALHEKVGALAAVSRLDLLVCVGSLARDIAAGAVAHGMDVADVACFEDVESALAYLKDALSEGDLVLVKASRFMGLERIVKGILE